LSQFRGLIRGGPDHKQRAVVQCAVVLGDREHRNAGSHEVSGFQSVQGRGQQIDMVAGSDQVDGAGVGHPRQSAGFAGVAASLGRVIDGPVQVANDVNLAALGAAVRRGGALRTVPGVDMDAYGRISVRGSASVLMEAGRQRHANPQWRNGFIAKVHELAMMGIIAFAGVIEGRLPPEKQGRPYSGGRPKDYRNH
jgi:hypothetical protein